MSSPVEPDEPTIWPVLSVQLCGVIPLQLLACWTMVLTLPQSMYDPAFSSHDRLPRGKFDAVLCSDVLEHVPFEETEEFVGRLFDYANKFVWASVCCRLAKKEFEDGLNMHVNVQPFWWWSAKFAKLSNGKSHVLVETR